MTDLQKTVFLKLFDNICPICNKKFPDKIRTSRHIKETHTEFMKDIIKFREEYTLATTAASIECPICKSSFMDLSRHVKHKHGMRSEEFKYKYPLVPLKSISALPEMVFYTCDICGKECNGKNSLVKHYQREHPENVTDVRPTDTVYKHYECPICKNKTNHIRNHVGDGHGISWESFCGEYNWDIKDSRYVTDEYRKNLSNNKKQYYKSEAGLERKKLQSIAVTGEKNPSCRPETRSKISASAAKRIDCHAFFNHSYGIKAVFIYNNKRYSLRSFEELKIISTLLHNNIDFEYEKTRVRYVDENGVFKTYVLDLEVNNEYFEIKSNKILTADNELKYASVQRALTKINKKLNIVTASMFFEHISIIQIDTIQFCRDMLLKGDMLLTCYTYKQNSRILRSIDENYKNNKNIKFIQRTLNAI